MYGELFYWLFNMSIVASITGLVVMLIRRIRRIPRRVVTVLWLIPFLRMWLPIGFGNEYSLMSLISRFATRTVVVYRCGEDKSFSMINCVTAASDYFPITYKVNVLEDVFKICSYIWLAGVGILLAVLCVIYAASIHDVKKSVRLRENIYLSDKIPSPAVYGILRPKIILPASYREGEPQYILMHEKAHIRRADNLKRIIALVTVCLHWFNPFAWLFLKCYLSDLELACDEKVLAVCDEEQKKGYALSLISCAESKSIFASAFGGAKIHTRMENIISYKKMTWLSAVGFTALIAAAAYILLTNAA